MMAGTRGVASISGDVSAAAMQRSAISSAARSTSSALAIFMPASASASGMFGVTTSARGNSSATSASTAAPLVATITGSTTILQA